jgi:hypothetical protein
MDFPIVPKAIIYAKTAKRKVKCKIHLYSSLYKYTLKYRVFLGGLLKMIQLPDSNHI